MPKVFKLRKELPIIRPFRLDSVGVTATDERSLSTKRIERMAKVQNNASEAMLESMNVNGSDYKLCDDQNKAYRTAYKVAQAANPALTFEEFNKQYLLEGHDDFTDVTKQVFRFDLRHDTNKRLDGAMLWSNSRIVDRDANQVTLRMQCVVTFLPRPNRSYFQLWGRSMRELMERADITLIGGRNLEILGFDFPTSTRHVAHVNAPGKTNMTDFENELLGGKHTITRETSGAYAGLAPKTVLKRNAVIPNEV